jgi:hypothetical protein
VSAVASQYRLGYDVGLTLSRIDGNNTTTTPQQASPANGLACLF